MESHPSTLKTSLPSSQLFSVHFIDIGPSHYIQEAEVIDSVLNAVRRIFDMYRLDKNECRRTLVRWICQRNEMKIRETNERVKAITERLDTINKTEQARFEQKLQQEISQFCESPEGRILPQTEVHLSSGSSGQNRAPYTEMPAASDHHDL